MKHVEMWQSKSTDETIACAERFANRLKPGACVGLIGPLGSGKTVFVKGMAKGLGVSNMNEVRSPTFVLLHIYEGRIPIHHFDFYRLESDPGLEVLGIEDYLYDPKAISIIEWADRIPDVLEQTDVRIELKIESEIKRTIQCSGSYERT